MLNYKEVHLLIEQGLNTLGIFSELAHLREQIDLSVKHITVKELTDVLNIKPDNRSSFETILAKELSATIQTTVEKGSRYYTSVIPPSFVDITSALLIVASTVCTEKYEVGKGYYVVKSDSAIYKGATYKKGSIIYIAEENINYVTYGEVEKSETKTIPVTILDPDVFNVYANSASFSFNMALLTHVGDEVRISYETRYRGRQPDTPVALILDGYSSDTIDTKMLSWCDEKTLNFPDPVQHYLIDKTIAYLAVISKQNQNNIVNLKTETII